jgi:hypothetical protein
MSILNFAVRRTLSEHFSKEELDKVFVPPKPKLESLVATMEKAKQRTGCQS